MKNTRNLTNVKPTCVPRSGSNLTFVRFLINCKQNQLKVVFAQNTHFHITGIMFSYCKNIQSDTFAARNSDKICCITLSELLNHKCLIVVRLTFSDSFSEVEAASNNKVPNAEISKIIIASYRRKKQFENETLVSMDLPLASLQ